MEQLVTIIACGGMVVLLWLGLAVFVEAITKINKRGKWKVLRGQGEYDYRARTEAICNHLKRHRG